MAAGMEGAAARLLPASPVLGRLVHRIRALDGSGQKRKKWAANVGDQVMDKLLDMATYLAKLQIDLVGIEKALTMAADLARRLLEIRDAAYCLHDLVDKLEYGRIRSRLAKDSEVRAHPLLIPSLLLLGRSKSKHGSSSSSSSFEIDQIRLLEEFRDGVAQSRNLITLLGKEKGNNIPGVPSVRILALDPQSCVAVAATVSLEHRVFGREDDQDNIVRWLINSSYRLSVVFMVGRCGVGKTPLAQLVYNDTRVKQHFDLRIWVSVSGSLNKVDITREILQSANPGYTDKMARADFQMLQSELSTLVASQRFLLVLDDLIDCSKMETMHTENWTDIFAPLHSAETGSSVLVNTPMMMVAQMPDTSQPYAISTLDKSKCSDLFMECAPSSKNFETSPQSEHVPTQMADKLHGLPLAAKVLGGVLGATSSSEERRSTMDRISSVDVALHSLQLSYDFLPPQIKECFAYCSLFPKNWKFDRTKLIQLWMAEGFLEPQENPEKRMEDLGSKYFDTLVSLSCFQEHKQGSKTYYLMHHWFHDLAEAVSANVCFRIEPGSAVEVPSTVRHLSVTTDSPLDLNGCCLPKQLRTLLVLRSPLYSLQDDHLRKVNKLHVLDLSGCYVAQLPESIGELVHLRYLSLCGTLRRLPESLSSLLHLQILCFPEDCCLDELPTGTTNLVNLRYLNIDTKYMTKLAGIRHLVNLQGSVELHVEKGRGHILQDLRDINGLRGHLKISGLDNVSSKEEVRKAKLNNKQYLKTLKLEWTTATRFLCHTTDAEVLENLQPHPNIKELSIRRYGGSIAPSWLHIPLLKELQSLHLINCRNLSILPPLGQLPSLEKLYMKELCAVTQIGPEFYHSNDVAFPSLKVLELVDFPRLLEWSREVNCTSFPCLKSLRLIDCPELKQIPSLPASTTEVTVERICSIRRLKLARFSTSSVMLTMDSCMTTVLCKRLFLQQHLETITVLSINGGQLFYTTEGLGSLLSLQKLQLCQSDMTDHNFSLFVRALPSLSSLEMTDLPNITALPVQADLNIFSKLVELHIRNCPLLSSLSSLQVFISLKCLVIERCPKLTAASFPTSFGSLASLKMLSISYCSQLQALPVSGLPSSLQELNLIGCHPNLVEQSRNKKDDPWKIATVSEQLMH